MTTYPDLAPYTYLQPDGGVVTEGVRTVGWLGPDAPFPTGDTPEGLVEALLVLAAYRAEAVMRGYHPCELCPSPGENHPVALPCADVLNGRVELGCAEVRVTTPDGAVLAAPTLVAHYVRDHRYLPPEAFTRAALADAEELRLAWEADKAALPMGTRGRAKVIGPGRAGVVLLELRGLRGALETGEPSVSERSRCFPDGLPVDVVVTGHLDRGRVARFDLA